MAAIKEQDAAWANSAAANTSVDVNVDRPLNATRATVLVVRNPSTVTALTIRVKAKETLGGAARYADVGNALTVPVNSVKQFTLDPNWLLAEGGRLTLSNDTVLGVADGFTANVRIRQAG